MKFFVIFFTFFYASISNAEIHSSLNDKSFYKAGPISVNYDGVVLKIRVYHQKSIFDGESYSNAFIESVTKQTMINLFDFLRRKKLKRMSCGLKPQSLILYIVSGKVLNDRSRFSISSLENNGLSNNSYIIGYYDPTHYDSETDSIMLTNISTVRNNILLAHELSHYFYNRFCAKSQTLQNTEPFAVEFQDYYSKINGL
jgi:hypothetical protein